MFCSQCGTLLSDDSEFCTNCGAKVTHSVPSDATKPTEATAVQKPKNRIPAIIAIVVVAVLGIWLASVQIEKANLKHDLSGRWIQSSPHEDVVYYLELTFSDDEIEYNFVSMLGTDELDTMKYTVISGNEIKIEDIETVFTIEFSDDNKDLLEFSPAFPGSDDSMFWFKMDE